MPAAHLCFCLAGGSAGNSKQLGEERDLWKLNGLKDDKWELQDDASQLRSDWQCGRDLLWGNMTNVASRPSGELLVEGLVDRSLQESSTKEESELALQQCSERSEKLAAGLL